MHSILLWEKKISKNKLVQMIELLKNFKKKLDKIGMLMLKNAMKKINDFPDNHMKNAQLSCQIMQHIFRDCFTK